jgi:hypothetical protein
MIGYASQRVQVVHHTRLRILSFDRRRDHREQYCEANNEHISNATPSVIRSHLCWPPLSAVDCAHTHALESSRVTFQITSEREPYQ